VNTEAEANTEEEESTAEEAARAEVNIVDEEEEEANIVQKLKVVKKKLLDPLKDFKKVKNIECQLITRKINTKVIQERNGTHMIEEVALVEALR
jgi:hypothetical protein